MKREVRENYRYGTTQERNRQDGIDILKMVALWVFCGFIAKTFL